MELSGAPEHPAHQHAVQTTPDERRTRANHLGFSGSQSSVRLRSTTSFFKAASKAGPPTQTFPLTRFSLHGPGGSCLKFFGWEGQKTGGGFHVTSSLKARRANKSLIRTGRAKVLSRFASASIRSGPEVPARSAPLKKALLAAEFWKINNIPLLIPRAGPAGTNKPYRPDFRAPAAQSRFLQCLAPINSQDYPRQRLPGRSKRRYLRTIGKRPG